ncbi:MAG: membrane protein insertion efficiency factor YidD [Pseudomonadota bacterium]
MFKSISFPVILLIKAYQLILSPIIGPRCRYLPTCSEYTLEAISTHGLLKGVSLGARRLARCHPWGGSGYDPVPLPKSASSTNKTCQENDACCGPQGG